MSSRAIARCLCGCLTMMFLALPASGQGLILQARPVGNPAGGAGVSNEKAGLHIPRGRRVNFNTYLNDGAGFRWDIQYHLNIGQGMNHAYSGGLYCQINNSNVSSNGNGWMNADGDEIEIGPWSRDGNIQIYRRCKVYKDQGLARWMDIFVNPSGSARTVPVRIYTCTSSSIVQTTTSSGGAAFSAKDWAFITTPDHGRPSLLHVVCGPKSKVRPDVRISGNTIYANYNITVPARGTAVLCYFEAQGHSAAELKKRLSKLRIHKLLSDLSPEVRKLIVNFRSRSFLQDIELERSGAADAVLLKNGDAIFGRITNEKFTIEAFYGTLELPAEKVIGFAAAAGREDITRAVLVGGQVVSGKLISGPVKFSLPTGGELEIPFSRLRQCTYQVSKDKPNEFSLNDPLILLRTGDRLAFDPSLLECSFMTRHGEVKLEGKDLMEVQLLHEEGGVHRATFLNGSTLAGMLGPERIVLPTRLGPQLDISRDMILAVRFAQETTENPSLACVRLSNEDTLFGRLADEAYNVTMEFGKVQVKPVNIVAMAFEPRDPRRVMIKLWDGSVLRGQLRQKTLRFTLDPGPSLDLHVGQIVGLACPEALPPENIVKQVEKYVGMLSATSFKDREEAQAALLRMGKVIVPLLKKHVNDTDPEVRQRISAILEKLGADASSGAAPQPSVGFPHIILRGWR